MEELFGAGLLDPQGMYHFDVLCRADAKSHAQAPSQPLVAPRSVEIREQVILPEISLCADSDASEARAAAGAHHKHESADGLRLSRDCGQRFSEDNEREASAGYSPAAPATAPRRCTAPRRPTKRPPKAPAPSAQLPPKPRPALPKADDWQFPQGCGELSIRHVARAARAGCSVQAISAAAKKRRGTARSSANAKASVKPSLRAALGVPPQTVIAWEDGTVLPSPKVSRMLAAIEEKGLNAVG